MTKLALNIFIAFWLCMASKCVVAETENDPLLVVVLMVKNEASVIKATLKPFVDARASTDPNKLAFLIFDTGSTDNTISVTKEYFQKNKIHNAIIKQEPFIDFATSRNRGLQLAEEAFPNARFMLMPDAEWYMQNVDGLIEFCQKHKNDSVASYLVRLINGSLDFYTARLIRCRSGVNFVGVVHETLSQVSSVKVPKNCFFDYRPGTIGNEASQKRWSRDLGKLLDAHKNNPRDPRTTFYIAQTYQCLGDLVNAQSWYKLRLTMTWGWDEENFMACYRLAQVCESLGDWNNALCYYLQAFSMRPCRAEPLVRLAQHYYNVNNMELCCLFSQRATEIPYPDKDVLFIDKELYDYTRYDLLGISAWYVHKYKIGKAAVENALKTRHDISRLQKNLAFYQKRSAIKDWKNNIASVCHNMINFFSLNYES